MPSLSVTGPLHFHEGKPHKLFDLLETNVLNQVLPLFADKLLESLEKL